MGKGNFQKIGFGVHGGGEPCGPRRGGKVEYTPEEVNALLDKLAAIMEKGGGGSQPMDLSGVELTKNKREFIRPYKENEQGGNFADHDHYASERAVAQKLYSIAKDIESMMDGDNSLWDYLGNLDYFDEEAQFPEGLLPEQFNVSDVLKALYLYILLKQNKLVSGENIKTINGESILGSGNMEIGTGPAPAPVPVDAYTKNESDERYVRKDGSKGLSTNDYTTEEKNKLAGIQDRANYQDVVWPYGSDTLFKTDNEEMLTPIVTAQEILAAAHGVTDTQLQTGLQALQQQINDLSARLTGVNISVVPTTATVGQQGSFAITITTTAEAQAVLLTRNNTQIFTSETAGTSWSYTDVYTPQSDGVIKYKAIVEVSAGVYKENEVSVIVGKQNAGLAWSYNNATVYTGYSGNQYPTLINPNNLAVTYESSNTSVATVNSSGVVTLVGAGAAQISAIFAGNGTYNASTVKYSLNVIQDAVNSLAWSGQSLSPSTLLPNGTATLTKGSVIATYLSGKTENVTGSATFAAQRGSISGTTYTAPATTGNDVISVSYGSKTAASKINVTVQEEPKLNVYFGHGSTYANATFTNTGEALHNNQGVTINTSNGDYLFVKVDKRDTVNNLYMHVEGGGYFEWQQIELDAAVTDGDFKYYATINAFREFTGLQFVINKV